jgi:hypothetical protein
MGDERERTWAVIQCVECGAVAEPSDESWEGWCSDGGTHGDTRKVAVVEASVLEERDRIIEEFRERGMTLDQLLADEVTAAVALRSQLTEARARNLELLKSECPNCDERLRVNVGLVIENKELRKRVDELEHGVPAPQDREPTT